VDSGGDCWYKLFECGAVFVGGDLEAAAAADFVLALRDVKISTWRELVAALVCKSFQQRNKNHRVHARLGFFNFFKKVIFFPQKTGKKRQHGAR